MSKRDNTGEIISNKLAVAAAQQHQALFASLAGAAPDASLFNPSTAEENNDEDLRDSYVDDEQFGVGATVPKDIADGSFTRRIPASDDKLLQQLLGKKAAKAHLSRQVTKNVAKPQGNGKPQRSVVNEEESEEEEEEEGRASAFKSKRQKMVLERVRGSAVDDAGDDAAVHEAALGSVASQQRGEAKEKAAEKRNGNDGDSEDDIGRKGTTKSRAVKARPGSYLDELLAGRSNKKQKKK